MFTRMNRAEGDDGSPLRERRWALLNGERETPQQRPDTY